MLRADLLARVESPRFWTDYMHLTQPDWPSTRDLHWELPLDLGTSVGLELVIDYGTSAATMLVRDSGPASPVEVAWDDQAHWHPHVFRWPELSAVCQRIAARCDQLPHPGVPLLLLYRFAPLTSEAEYQLYAPLLERAWASLDAFGPADVVRLIDRVDFRNQGVEWRHADSVGWTVEQREPAERDLYSLRILGNTAFPFKAWNTLMAELQADAQVP